MNKKDLKTVLDNHALNLMKIEGVTGIMIGETEDQTPCILIMIVEESEQLRSKLPITIEGHPVRLEVSGEIKPM